LYVAAHAPFVPTSLEDIDSVNFALGLHDFDPLKHQPHPPGYPVYIALGKASRVAIQLGWPGLDAQTADAIALSVWSVVGGGVSILLAAHLFLLLGRLGGLRDAESRALGAVLLLATCSLFWISGLRPLSDMPGLTAALAAQVLLLRACVVADRHDPPTWIPLAAGACVAGLAVGLRLQVLWLVGPLLAAAIVWHRRVGLVAAGVVAASFFGLGALVWAIPLVIASGGISEYMAAVRGIALADFTNVQMLWTHPSARQLAIVLVDTFAKPWGSLALAQVVLTIVAAGLCLLVVREQRVLVWLSVLFLPYLISHVLFQETLTIRYALPVVVPVAWVASSLLMRAGVRAGLGGAAVISAASLVIAYPVVRTYGEAPLPANAAIRQAVEGLSREGGVLAGHFEFARAFRVSGARLDSILPSPEFGERLELVRYWTGGGRGPVWFVASPARTDLDLVDPNAQRVLYRSEWRFARDWFVGGIRPAHADLVRIDSPPGWVAGEGWHLTRQEIILSERRSIPAAAMYVARRTAPATMFVGGEYAGDAAGGDVQVAVALDGREILRAGVNPASPRFFESLNLPAGLLAGEGQLAAMSVAWQGSGPSPARVHLTQFELQSSDRSFWIYSHGWHDREYDAQTEREWRWTSDRAELRVHAAGRDMRVRVSGTAPVGDLGGTPTVTMTAAGTRLHSFQAGGPFTETFDVSAATLELAGGAIAIDTSLTFVPDERTGSGDRRRLGLQVFQVEVGPIRP
jgi:hypothetical protein